MNKKSFLQLFVLGTELWLLLKLLLLSWLQLVFPDFGQVKIDGHFLDFGQVKIDGYFSDFGQVKIHGHFAGFGQVKN